MCLNFYEATSNAFYLNNHRGEILELDEDAYTSFCKIKIDNLHYIISFNDEVELVIDGHVVKLWLGNATWVQRNIAHLCFQAVRDVRILTQAVYSRINGTR